MTISASIQPVSKRISIVPVPKKAINHECHQHIGMRCGGNIFDSPPVCYISDKIPIKGIDILGDKAYGSHTIHNSIINHEATYTIPPRSNAKTPWNVDWYLYK